jgi:ergothioneine biosynthesis protein EgtB
VDAAIEATLPKSGSDLDSQCAFILELGLNHEQQHQELLLTDLKHAFASNPLRPVYRERPVTIEPSMPRQRWMVYPSGLRAIGHNTGGFAYDNEGPCHPIYVKGFRLSHRLITNQEYLEFMEEGGYREPRLWLSDGWQARLAGNWISPLYWEAGADGWQVMTLAGRQTLCRAEPVCHVSYYEADAFARWAGARLPTEAEWEVAAMGQPVAGNWLDGRRFHPGPLAADPSSVPAQLFGDVWEWTSSPYTAYPGYRPAAGALGEYNGKFMCNQMVLRGGSCVTPEGHIRPTYRNFFPPTARWQFTGLRLANDP